MNNTRIANKSYTNKGKTYQQTLSSADIKEKLKEYCKVENITTVSIGTHIRYFTIDPKTKEKTFRLGGTLNKIDPEHRFIILSNGTVTWSAQIPNCIFFKKLTDAEIKAEMKEELKKEVMSEVMSSDMKHLDDINDDLKSENKILKKKVESLLYMEKEYKSLVKKNELLSEQLDKIKIEIRKEKNKEKK
jgi:hypothetical protein